VTLRNPDYLLSQLLLTAAEKYPDRPALIFPDARLTYAQLSELSQRYARAMVGHGLSRGDHVGILAVNRLEYIALLIRLHVLRHRRRVAQCAFPRSRITACGHTL
jgi:acyl-CoA synthetase (AMP-forming)/AMP-acid ligase II